MLEVPAIGVALWALGPIWQWRKNARWTWLALSGAILAVALQIKLTAIILVPALALELIVSHPRANLKHTIFSRWVALTAWGTSIVISYAGLVTLFGTVPWRLLWISHFDSKTISQFGYTETLPYLRILWEQHIEMVWGLAGALLVAMLKREVRVIAFPFSWLLGAMLIHSFHRPWWSYYYLHLAVPFAWLSGYAISGLFQIALNKNASQRPLMILLRIGLISFPLASLTVFGGDRLLSNIYELRHLPHVSNFEIIAKMREYAWRTNFLYTRNTIYAFHAGILIIPELAVLPSKRFYAREVTEDHIWASISRFHPEQLFLGLVDYERHRGEILSMGYKIVFQSSNEVLLVLSTEPNPQQSHRIYSTGAHITIM